MNSNPTNAQEQYELGEKYEKGDGVFKDLSDALKWYTKAAEQGHADSLYKLSYIHLGLNSIGTREYGWNVEINKEQARRFLLKAVERGSVRAMSSLAATIYLGNTGDYGFAEDHEKSAYWYEKAAELGDAYSQYRTGKNYYHGSAVKKDLEKARYWITLAAKQGHKDAQEDIDKLNAGKSLSWCYIATCVYGSYDCPEVWTLRRYRDNRLSASWFGRQFICIYYTVSPKLVELFGDKTWFRSLWKLVLNKLVSKLQENGVEGSPYSDL